MENNGNLELKDLLTVAITSHILPTAPSTEYIEKTIQSLRDSFKGIEQCNIVIYCDSDVSKQNYSEYIENLKNLDKKITVKEYKHSGYIQTGLRDNHIKSIVESNTPFVFYCEHDWTFNQKIDLGSLMKTMQENKKINYVRFNKRDNFKSHKDNPRPGDQFFWETYVEEEKISDLYFMKTDSFTTHPHIVRASKFKNDWLKHVIINLKELKKRDPWFNAVGIVETILNNEYKKEINIYGFEKAHQNWGTYNYGSKEFKKMSIHTDGSNSGLV